MHDPDLAPGDDDEPSLDDFDPTDEEVETEPDSEDGTESESVTPPDEEYRRGWLAISDLVLEHKFWQNPRSFTGLDDESMAALAGSIRAGTRSDDNGVYAGVRDALEVVPIRGANGTTVNLIIDGQRRFRAAQLAGLTGDVLLPVLMLETEPVAWSRDLAARYLARALESVGQRAQLSSYELAMNAASLRASIDQDTGKEYTLARIAAAVGRSESWVSKILTALENSSAKLQHRWKVGELTDEQFKDLARAKDQATQDAAADRAAAARSSGSKGAARQIAKELKATESAKSSPPSTAADGKQQTMPPTPPRKPMPLAKVEDLIQLTRTTPPTHDLVKGILLGIQVAAGVIDSGALPKPWHAYVERLYGAEVKARDAGAKAAKPAKVKPAKATKDKPTPVKKKPAKKTKK